MATRLYFHDATTSISNPPASEQSTATANTTATGATTTRSMNRNIGTAQASVSISSTTASGTAQFAFFRTFVSPALVSNTTISADTLTWNVADAEGNAASNFWVGGVNLYVWRPSTGTKIGTLVDNVTGTQLGTEGTTTASVTTGTVATSSVSALAGDVLICEVWSNFNQSMGTSYTNTFYYDGTTVTTVENTATTSHASFIELSQNLSLAGDPQSLSHSTRYTNPQTFYSPTITQPNTRFSKPVSDVAVGGWVTDTNATTNLYAVLDENTPGSDVDYIKTTVSGSVYSVNLDTVLDPLTSSEQILRYRIRSSSNNSITVTLKQGTTTIATRTHTQVPATFSEYNMILSAAECNAITNYGLLKVEIYAT